MLTSLSKLPGNTFEQFLLKFCLTNLLIPSIQIANAVFGAHVLAFVRKWSWVHL